MILVISLTIILQANPDVTPFWQTIDFWVFLILSFVGVALSGYGAHQANQAKIEATKARIEATNAGKVVRVQTVAVELLELSQLVEERLDKTIDFKRARDLFSLVNRKLQRHLAQIGPDSISAAKMESLNKDLENLKTALDSVRPSSSSEEIPGTTYWSVEAHFLVILGTINSIIGELEKIQNR